MNEFIENGGDELPSLTNLITLANKTIIGQETLVEAICVCLYRHLIKMASGQYGIHLNASTNLLIRGSTGTGKTYAVKTICAILGLPFIEINAKSICQEGWEGQSLRNMILKELNTLERGWKQTIVFIDEFDKLVTPISASRSHNYSVALQASMLKYIEGIEMSIDGPNIRTAMGFTSNKEHFTTADFCFIFAGSFEGLFPEESSIGFDNTNNVAEKEYIKALINFGMMPEIAGRISYFVNTTDFTKEMYVTLVQTDSFICNKWIKVLNTMGFTKNKIKLDYDFIIKKAIDKNLGARGLIQCIDEEINKSLLDNKLNVSIGKFLKL